MMHATVTGIANRLRLWGQVNYTGNGNETEGWWMKNSKSDPEVLDTSGLRVSMLMTIPFSLSYRFVVVVVVYIV